jgi:methylamine utilization protein MauJ
MAICAWLVMAFDSEEQDPRDYLKTEYGGLELHIKPGHGDAVSLVSTFLEDNTKYAETQLIINRFLSAMSWKEGKAFVSLGAIAGGAYPTERDKPRFNYSEGRLLRYAVISRFDFEHLQNPPGDKQKLALALFREGLNSYDTPLYRFLSFFKILNIKFSTGKTQVAWINSNLGKIWNFLAQERLVELQKTVPDIGDYLWIEGRNAIAHANTDPILDPDMPTDRAAALRDADLMQGLAEVFIQEELDVPSQRKIWREHLYELEGFKRLFGDALTARLKAKASVPPADFPQIPPLTLNLKEQPSYDCLTALTFRVAECKDGIVLLSTDHTAQPMAVALVLNFPAETLELALHMFGVNQKQGKYTKAVAACSYRFLIGYFCNGYLQVFDATTNERLSHKTAFIPVDIDLHATVEGWKKKIEELEAE